MAKNQYLSLDEIAAPDTSSYFSIDDAVGDPIKQDRSYLGAAVESGARSLAAAGATILDTLNPFTLSEEDAATLYKNDPEGFKKFQEKSASAVLQRFASEQTKRAREVMQEVTPTEKGLVSDKPIGELEYATLDPEKAAYLSPTRVAGDVLQSLPTTLALAVSGYLTRGKSVQAYETALARETAKGLSKAEAQAIAKAEAVREGAKTMAVVGGASEGIVTGAQQYNQALDEVNQISPDVLATAPEYQALLDEGYAPETAKAVLANKVASQSGVSSGVTTGLISAAGGKFLGGMVGEGGKLLPRVGKGALVEGLTEAPQSSLEQINQNLAMSRANPNQDILEGAGEAGIAGLVVGGVTGGGFAGAFGSPVSESRRRKLAEDKLKAATDVSTAAAAADEMAGSLDELTASVDQYLASGQRPPLAQAEPVKQSAQLTPQQAADREAQLLAQANQAGTDFDRRMAMDQISILRQEPTPGAATGYVDLTPMTAMQVQQRLAVMRDQAAQAGGNALGLEIVSHPEQNGRFAIIEKQLPSLELTPNRTPISTQEAQVRIESAALAGQERARKAEDSPRQQMISRAMAAIESRGGVASPMEAEILRQANMGQPYDRIDPTLGQSTTPAQTTPRETIRPAAMEQANAEGLSEQAARTQANQAQAQTQLTQQIQETSQPAPLPNASDVIAALATPGAQRTAEQTSLIRQGESRYDPVDFSIMQRAATAPFQLSADERVRLKDLRSPPANVPENGTNVPESGTTVPESGLIGTRVTERLGTPAPGRIITSGAKLSTQRGVAPGATLSVKDGETSHDARVVDIGRLGTTGRLINQIGRIFGKRVVAFESDTLQADGFVLDEDNQNIYINTKSQMSPLAVFGHEMTHLLKRDNSEAYTALQTVVQRQLGEGAMERFTQEYGEGANIEELTSDLVGNRFQESDFWQGVFDEIAAQNPEGARAIIIRTAAAITKAINAFMRLVRQPSFQADQYIKDANEIKKAVRTALATYAQSQKTSAMQMEAELVKAEPGVDLAAGSEAAPAAPAQPERVPLEQRQREAARAARQQMGETITASPARMGYNVSATNTGEENAREDNAARAGGLPADAGQNRPEPGGDGRSEVPSYGQPREGAVSVVGRHYSPAQRQTLDGNYYGRGLRGAEARRLDQSTDPRLRQRIYFYVDTGAGIQPESGVGAYAHEVRLDNLYDPESRIIPPQPDSNAFESAVINAGFDGYVAPFGNQNAAVLLGPTHSSVPVAPVSNAQLSRQRNTNAEVPENVDSFAKLEQVFPRAREGSFNTNRDLKLSLQNAILAAAREAGVDLSGRTPEVEQYLTRVGVADAMYAIRSNANAVGWYDKTVTKALKILGKLHPEINTDPNAKFAFTWALAVTSNGQKVDKNFELAEAAYKAYKRTGRMPTNLRAGQAQKAINDGLSMFNDLVEQYGIDDVRSFMDTKFLVSQIERATGLTVGGEFKDTQVRGAAVLGPKIGNGFFSNLNGFFDQLTMDRWLMRTWGRWTGSLIERRPDMVKAKREELITLVTEMKKNAPAAAEFQKALGRKLTVGNPDALAQAIQKASMLPATREKFNKTPVGESLRKTGNALAKYLDGQKEAPAGPEERNFIRRVFGQILDQVREKGFPSLTMSDLQALLWYPEKRLYDIAKSDEDAQESYADDEAPDYANAAAKLAKANGVSEQDIKSAISEAEKEYETRERAGSTQRDAGDQQAQARPEGGARGFTERGQRQFLTTGIIHRLRSDRERNEAASGPYSRRSGGDGKGLRVLGQPSVAVYSPAVKFKNALGEIPAAAPKFFELDAQGAQLFQDAIQASKDATPFGAAVYVYPLEDYQGMRLFVTEDAKAGFALKGDDIVSVFAGPEQRGAVNAIMQLAIQEGGRRLDAFDTVLPDLYAVHGFKIVARSPWNDEFAPDGWSKATFNRYNSGEPDVVFMVYDANYFGSPQNSDGAVIQDYDEGAVKQREALGQAAPAKVSGAGATLSRQRNPQIDTPEFKRWFGDSKVVDENGDPLVMYHGTPKDFSEFNTKSRSILLGSGSYFTANPVEADDFTMSKWPALFGTTKPQIVPVYLSIKNPYVTDNKIDSQAREEAIRERYDGIIVRGKDGQIEWAVVFEPNQIKSATGNQGTFDRNNADITMSRRRQINTPEFKRWFSNSKVVDENGKPLVVYHGSDKAGIKVFESEDDRFYFVDKKAVADEYGVFADTGKNAETYAVYLRMQRPDVYDMNGASWYEDGVASEVYGYIQDAKDDGYDGVILKNFVDEAKEGGAEPSTVYIVFSPSQIKSATGNSGAFDPNNPDITQSRRRNIMGQPAPLATWTAPTETKFDDFIYVMQDKMVDTKRVVDAVRAAVGNIDDKWNPYLQEELYHGRTAKATKDFLNNELRPLLQEMQMRKIEMAEFEEYLHNRHAEERNIQIAKVNPNMSDGGSGIDTADARAYLNNLDPNKRRQFDALARRIDAINASTRQLLVASGLETQDTINAWEAAYKNYVPLQREDLDFSTQFTGMGTGQGYQVKGSSSKRATGSSRPVVDIMANIAMQRERAIVRAEKTRVAQAVYGMAVQNPNTDFWLAIDPEGEKDPAKAIQNLIGMGINPVDAQNIIEEPKQTFIDPRTGLVTQRVNPLLRNSPNVLAVRINGDEKYVFFNANDERSQRMVGALKNLDAEQLNWAMNIFAQITRYFAAVNTQYNPIFGAINLMRDVQGATLQLSTTPIADRKKEVLANVIPALRGIYADVRAQRKGQPAPGGVWASLWEEFQREGGQTGFRDQFSKSAERAEALERELKQITEGKVKQAGRAIFDWLSDYNETMENAVRLSAYKAAKDKGLSIQQAASIAKNLTVNFNRKGQVATQAGALYAFFNAAVQGTTRLGQTLTGPAGKTIVGGGLILGALQAVMLAAAGFDDDEPPDFVKERNLIIPLANGKYLTVPMPLGYNVIPNTSRVMTEFVLSGFRDPAKRVAQITGAFLEMFNPIGNAGWSAQTLAPTIADPIVALTENRDWTGKPIAKKDMSSTDPTPGYTRAKETASWFSKQLSYYLNLASGGTKYKQGLISPTPDQLDYLIGQATGGVGRELMKAEQSVTSQFTGEELPPYKIPVVGRFYGDSKAAASESNRFYENITRINEHENEIKGRRKNREPVGDYLKDNPEARLVELGNRVEREVSELRRRRRDLLEKDASKESVKLIEQRITARMKQFNDRVRKLRDQQPAD